MPGRHCPSAGPGEEGRRGWDPAYHRCESETLLRGFDSSPAASQGEKDAEIVRLGGVETGYLPESEIGVAAVDAPSKSPVKAEGDAGAPFGLVAYFGEAVRYSPASIRPLVLNSACPW